MQTESEIQREVMAFLKVCGFLVYRMNSGSVRHNVKMAEPGTPDIMAISPYGYTFWLEVKTETGKLSIIQKNMHSRLRSYGQCVFVVRCLDDVEKIVK